MPIYSKNCLIRGKLKDNNEFLRAMCLSYKMVKLQPIDKCPSSTIDARCKRIRQLLTSIMKCLLRLD